MVQSLNLGNKSRKNSQWETRSTFSFKTQTQMINNKRKQDILKQKLAFSLNKDEDGKQQAAKEKEVRYPSIFDQTRVDLNAGSKYKVLDAFDSSKNKVQNPS